jgi:hypothetical protein
MVADVKIINERANSHKGKSAAAAVAQCEAEAEAKYKERTGWANVRAWVFTPSGEIGAHARADLGAIARAMDVAKETVVAGADRAEMQGHEEVVDANEKAVGRGRR